MIVVLYPTVAPFQARKLVRDIRPKMVVVPEKYTVPPVQAPGRTELVVDTEVPSFQWLIIDS